MTYFNIKGMTTDISWMVGLIPNNVENNFAWMLVPGQIVKKIQECGYSPETLDQLQTYLKGIEGRVVNTHAKLEVLSIIDALNLINNWKAGNLPNSPLPLLTDFMPETC